MSDQQTIDFVEMIIDSGQPLSSDYKEGELNLSLAEHIEADARNKRRDIHDLGDIKVSDIPY